MPTIFALLCAGGFCLLFAGIGAFLVYKGFQGRKKAEASQNWPSTAGQITDARVSHSTRTDSDGDTTTTYTPHVEYVYQVGGQEYRGKNITFGFTQGYGSPGKAQEALARYPVGSQVSVYYDPSQPGESVLERKAGGFTLSLIIGGIFLVIGVCAGIPGVLWALVSLIQGQ